MTAPNNPLFVCFCDFTGHVAGAGWSFKGDLTDFDGAVDQFIEAREDGQDACVKELNLATNEMRDVTAHALDRAHHFWRCNHVDAPEWAMSAA